MYRESCQAAASHLKEGILSLRVPLGNDMFGLFDGAPDVVLCGSESDSDEVMVVVIMVVEEQFSLNPTPIHSHTYLRLYLAT